MSRRRRFASPSARNTGAIGSTLPMLCDPLVTCQRLRALRALLVVLLLNGQASQGHVLPGWTDSVPASLQRVSVYWADITCSRVPLAIA